MNIPEMCAKFSISEFNVNKVIDGLINMLLDRKIITSKKEFVELYTTIGVRGSGRRNSTFYDPVVVEYLKNNIDLVKSVEPIPEGWKTETMFASRLGITVKKMREIIRYVLESQKEQYNIEDLVRKLSNKRGFSMYLSPEMQHSITEVLGKHVQEKKTVEPAPEEYTIHGYNQLQEETGIKNQRTMKRMIKEIPGYESYLRRYWDGTHYNATFHPELVRNLQELQNIKDKIPPVTPGFIPVRKVGNKLTNQYRIPFSKFLMEYIKSHPEDPNIRIQRNNRGHTGIYLNPIMADDFIHKFYSAYMDLPEGYITVVDLAKEMCGSSKYTRVKAKIMNYLRKYNIPLTSYSTDKNGFRVFAIPRDIAEEIKKKILQGNKEN